MEVHRIHPKSETLERSVDSYLFSIPEETRMLTQEEYHSLRAATIYTLLQQERSVNEHNVIQKVAAKAGVSGHTLTKPQNSYYHIHPLRSLIAYIYRQFGYSTSEIGKKLDLLGSHSLLEKTSHIQEGLSRYKKTILKALQTDVPYIDHKKPTLDQHTNGLADLIVQGELTLRRPDILPNNVLSYFAKETGILPKVLTGKGKTTRVHNKRSVLYFLFKDRFHYSFPAIGAIMQRDHSSVMNGYQQIKQTYEAHQSAIEQQIQNSLIFPKALATEPRTNI